MRSRSLSVIAAAGLLASTMALPATAAPTTIASALTGGADLNLAAVSNDAPTFSSAADGFGVFQRDVSPSIPFSLLDDSLSIFVSDTLGIVGEAETDPFFGIVDTENGDNSGPVTATWVFDTSSVADEMHVNVDLGAMGDFESSDIVVLSASVDGGDATVAEVVIDESSSRLYTLDSGTEVTLNDPANIGDAGLGGVVALDDDFQTISLPVPAGDEVTFAVTAVTNGGTEAFALRRIEVTTGGPLGTVVAAAPVATCTTADEDLTLISEIQGSGADPDARFDSPLDGEEHTIRAVVTLADPDLGGYFVQEEPADDDGDPTTSEGLFVFDRRPLPIEGQTVELTDNVTAFNGLTQFSFPDTEVCDVELVEIAPTPLTLPLDRDGREALESMLVTNAQDLQVTSLFTAYRFGELGLAYPGPLTQPTSEFAPGTPEADALAQLNEDSLLKVNDRNEASGQFNPYPWERFDEDLSAGDTMPTGRLVGALNYSFGEFKVEPLDNEIGDPSDRIFFPETDDTFPIPAVPALEDGNDIVAFNVLNYFDTFDGRGARDQAQFDLQSAKIVDAILEMDAAVYGLVELANDYEEAYDGDATTQPSVVTLVEQLNAVAGDGTFAAILPEEDRLVAEGLGPDEIAVGFIYQPAKAEPVGPATTFDIDALLFGDDPDNNRWPLAQTFKVDGEFVEVVVNHFKSKGSPCTDNGGPGFDLGEDVGTALTGNCNLTREYAARQLVEWVEGGATPFPTDDTLLIGDFNSYEEEGPIEILVDAGFVDLVQRDGDDAFTFKFDGRYGRLDYAFASPSLAAKVTDAAVWQINSPAPVGYLYFRDPQPGYPLYWASSDHDPVIVSLASDGVNGAHGKGKSPKRG